MEAIFSQLAHLQRQALHKARTVASSPSLGDPSSNVTTKIILIKVEAEKSQQPL